MVAPSELATLHALAFLVAGCAVGVLLAALLIAPRLGDAMAPLSYGRWMPVHLDVTLYGWASLPLVALLLRAFGADEHAPRLGRLAVHAWSAMVLAGCAAWLMGGSGGKQFLDWSGGARVVLVVGLSTLAIVLAIAFARASPAWTWAGRLGRASLLLALASVPAILAWATRADVYPSINPDSGGPTGVSLMGSVLGLVAILLLTPALLGARPDRRRTLLWAGLAAHGVAFLALEAALPGEHSHREPLEIAALASVAIWVPLLAWGLRPSGWPAPSGECPAQSREWLRASFGWGALLAASGLAAFLPGILERWKFTSALVAHAHVALAGFVTAWDMAVLAALAPTGLASSLGGPAAARAWNVSLALHLAALAGLAALEQRAPGGLLAASAPPLALRALLALRLLAGVAQLVVASTWCVSAARHLARRVLTPEPVAA